MTSTVNYGEHLGKFRKECLKEALRKGKGIRAYKINLEILKGIKKKTRIAPSEVIEWTYYNISPKMIACPIRLGGVRYKVPAFIKAGRGTRYMRSWLFKPIKETKKKNKFETIKNWSMRLSAAYKNKGLGIERKKSYYEHLFSNRAYIRYMR